MLTGFTSIIWFKDKVVLGIKRTSGFQKFIILSSAAF